LPVILLDAGHEVQCYVAVSECLSTMKQVLQRDLAMHVLIKWYGVRNAPGTQDISPAQEWQLFIGVLLGKISTRKYSTLN
jgi:anaphase-promoting complex subunit 1